MINLSAFDVITAEHNLRVDKVNRFGWLWPEATDGTRPSSFGAALIGLVRRPKVSRVTERPHIGDPISSAGQAQGAA